MRLCVELDPGPQHGEKYLNNSLKMEPDSFGHGPNIYKDTKPWKMSAFLKNLPVKVLGGRCLSVWEPRSPPIPLHTVWIHHTCTCISSHRAGGGRWTRDKIRRSQVHKRGRKYQHDWLYLQSINSIKHQRHLRFGVFIDIWSMVPVQVCTRWRTSTATAARRRWAGSTSTLSSPVRSTRRASTSSSSPTWSRRTAGRRARPKK